LIDVILKTGFKTIPGIEGDAVKQQRFIREREIVTESLPADRSDFNSETERTSSKFPLVALYK